MSVRVDQAEFRRVSLPPTLGPTVQLADAGSERQATAPLANRRSRALLRGPRTGSRLAAGLTPPASSSTPPPRVDSRTIGNVLFALVQTYERPLSFEELALAGLRQLVRDDRQLTVELDGRDLVIRDGDTLVSRRRLPDTAALEAREEAETMGGEERGLTPGFLRQPAWGNAVRTAIEDIHRARPGLVRSEQLTARFFAFLPEQLDPYTRYTGEGAGSKALFGISYGLQGGEPVVTIVTPGSPAATAGMEIGDRIVGLAGESVRGASLARIGEILSRHPEGQVSFEVERDGRRLTFTMERAVFDPGAVVTGHVERNVAVIRIRAFDLDTPEAVRNTFAELRAQNPNLTGVVLDLRANGGGHVSAGIEIADLFLDSGRITEQRYPRAPNTNREHDATAGDITNGLPMVVLINGGSYSAAELVALALGENGRATLMGSRSGGKGSMQAYPPFIPVAITTGRYHGPRGNSPHQAGVEPQVCIGPAPDRCASSVLAPASDITAAIDLLHSAR